MTDKQALSQCNRECQTAMDGRGRRWAKVRCVETLVANGTPEPWARRYADAVAQIAVFVRALPGVAP